MKYKVREGITIPFIEIEIIPETNEERYFLENTKPQFVQKDGKTLIVFGLEDEEA